MGSSIQDIEDRRTVFGAVPCRRGGRSIGASEALGMPFS